MNARKTKAKPKKKSPRTEPDRPSVGWHTAKDLASVFDVTVGGFNKEYSRLVPESAIEKRGPIRFFHARTLINAWLEDQIRKRGYGADKSQSSAAEADEEFRRERAALTRIKRLEAEGKLVPRAYVHEGFAVIASKLRGAGETLQRQYGKDALDILDRAIDEASAEIRNHFGEAESSPADTTTKGES